MEIGIINGLDYLRLLLILVMDTTPVTVTETAITGSQLEQNLPDVRYS
jgi:hypothetical protein